MTTNTTTTTTNTAPKAWAPDLTASVEDAMPSALINQVTTIAGIVEGDDVAVRVQIVDDDAATIVAEGAQIPEAAPELAEELVFTAKIAKMFRVSRELASHGNMAKLWNTGMISLIKKADEVFLKQAAPTAPAVTPPAGLLYQGITGAANIDTSLDDLVDALAEIQANEGNPSHILISPAGWGSLRKFKAGADSAQSLLGAGTADAEMSLLGIPVLINSVLPSGSGLVLDKSDIVSAVGEIQAAVSNEVYFDHDSVGARFTLRFGARVIHPDRHAVFTVTDPV